ncbi:MarR family winged helix-turn-helix transcriptional regulator [Frondihabitans cladoniiphilus]|uniref:MarR family transcriptional regulator n=1 Tax=Frondihabitans cladoniiphilus TaxID=715785 RepID=A0ABP8VL85_9MICO
MTDDPARTSHPGDIDPTTVELLIAWQSLEVASRLVREQFAHVAGLGLTDFQALVYLSAGDGSPTKAVGDSLGLTSGAMTALIDRIERAGYVTRVPHPLDRRSTLLYLTASGVEAAMGAGALYARIAETVVAPADRAAVTALFRSLAERLEAEEIAGA